MLTKAAYENTPYRTPASIRGPSLRDLHQQQRANDEVESLLASDSHAAGVKAFAKGVAAGSALPLILGGIVPWAFSAAGVHNKAVAQAHLAELMVDKGIERGVAATHAASIYHYLEGQKNKPTKPALDAISDAMKTYQLKMPTGEMLGPFTSRAEAAGVMAGHAESTGAKVPRAVREAAEKLLITELPPPKLQGKGPNLTQISAVLEEAAAAFKRGGKSLVSPLAKAHGLHAAKVFGRAAIPTALLGGVAGLYGLSGHLRKRRALNRLREEQARRSYRVYDSGVTR